MTTLARRSESHLDVRNAGVPLDSGRLRELRANRPAVERRAATISTRRTVKRAWQAAWLVRAVQCLDLTTLAGDDTNGTVRRLAAKARQPVRPEVLRGLEMDPGDVTVGAVCVYHNLVAPAVEALRGSGIPVAAVATGFPAGQTPFRLKIEEIEESLAAGAQEIDIVISRAHVLTGNWTALYDEVRSFREACGAACLKTILACGELGTLRNVAAASWVCMMAGADFIKTSTGKEAINATLPFGLVMARAIREYEEVYGYRVGLKPAGGIRTARQALDWLLLVKEELGEDWLRPARFRIGASSLLTDIERQLWHNLTGHYAASHHQPMP